MLLVTMLQSQAEVIRGKGMVHMSMITSVVTFDCLGTSDAEVDVLALSEEMSYLPFFVVIDLGADTGC